MVVTSSSDGLYGCCEPDHYDMATSSFSVEGIEGLVLAQ